MNDICGADFIFVIGSDQKLLGCVIPAGTSGVMASMVHLKLKHGAITCHPLRDSLVTGFSVFSPRRSMGYGLSYLPGTMFVSLAIL